MREIFRSVDRKVYGRELQGFSAFVHFPERIPEETFSPEDSFSNKNEFVHKIQIHRSSCKAICQ